MFMNADKRLYQPGDPVLKDWFGANYQYIKSAEPEAMASPSHLNPLINLFTQYMYKMHSYRLAEALVKSRTQVWIYRFDYSSDNSGANHAQELGYVWYSGNHRGFNQEEVKLALQMHQAWVKFIKGSNPGSINQKGWPLYTEQSRSVMVFDRSSGPEVLKDVYNDLRYPSAGFILK